MFSVEPEVLKMYFKYFSFVEQHFSAVDILDRHLASTDPSGESSFLYSMQECPEAGWRCWLLEIVMQGCEDLGTETTCPLFRFSAKKPNP